MGNDVNAYEILLARLNQLDSQVKAFMQAASLDLEDVHNRIETLFQLLPKEREEDKEDTPSTHSLTLSSDTEVKNLLRELIQEVKGLKGLKTQGGAVTSKTTDSPTTPKKRGRPRKNPTQETVGGQELPATWIEAAQAVPSLETTPQSFYAWDGSFPDPREYRAVE